MQFRRLIRPAALATAASLTVGAHAVSHYDTARVIDVTPVYKTVRYAVPVEECGPQTVRLPEYRAPGTAQIVGAVVGGAIGNAVGNKKRNKQVGAAVGAVLGASIASDIARASRGDSRVRYGTRNVCETFTEYRDQDRLIGYDVCYEHAGQTYTARMKRHPGDEIRVRVTPID